MKFIENLIILIISFLLGYSMATGKFEKLCKILVLLILILFVTCILKLNK